MLLFKRSSKKKKTSKVKKRKEQKSFLRRRALDVELQERLREKDSERKNLAFPLFFSLSLTHKGLLRVESLLSEQ